MSIYLSLECANAVIVQSQERTCSLFCIMDCLQTCASSFECGRVAGCCRRQSGSIVDCKYYFIFPPKTSTRQILANLAFAILFPLRTNKQLFPTAEPVPSTGRKEGKTGLLVHCGTSIFPQIKGKASIPVCCRRPTPNKNANRRLPSGLFTTLHHHLSPPITTCSKGT